MIGERLKRARAAAGLSMQALGEQAGVSANMIKKYEHDVSMPSSSMLLKLGKALGVRSEYFSARSMSPCPRWNTVSDPARLLRCLSVLRRMCWIRRSVGRNWLICGLLFRYPYLVV